MADELDARRRLVRKVISDLRALGYENEDLRGLTLPELDELRARTLLRLMAAPQSDRAS